MTTRNVKVDTRLASMHKNFKKSIHRQHLLAVNLDLPELRPHSATSAVSVCTETRSNISFWFE
jgi:hypothetical protein